MRRDAPDLGELELKNRLTCNSSRCAVIRCTTGPLVKESNAWIALRMRLVAQTINIVRIFICCLIFDRSSATTRKKSADNRGHSQWPYKLIWVSAVVLRFFAIVAFLQVPCHIYIK